MEGITVKELLIGVMALAQAIMVIAAFRLLDSLEAIRNHLAALNGSVKKCDSLREQHAQDQVRETDRIEDRLMYLERRNGGAQNLSRNVPEVRYEPTPP
jgi:hypothetical protein